VTTFTEVDDIEFSTSTDVPGAVFQDGAFTGLDDVIFFQMVAGSPVSKRWNPQCGGARCPPIARRTPTSSRFSTMR
jgi:hypothetical protein